MRAKGRVALTNGCETGPSCSGSCIAFSSDYTQFMLCNENRVTVQKSGSGVVLAKFHVPGKLIKCCCFSPDGSLVAVACDSHVYVWHIVDLVPQLVTVFTDHLGVYSSLVFSSPSSLISASGDKWVKFWQVGASSTNQVVTDLGSTVSTSPSIQFVSLQAKDGIAISGDSNGLVSIWDISTGLCKTSFQTPARGEFRGDAQLIDGQLVFIWNGKDTNHTTFVWDSDKCKPSHILGPGKFYGLRISGDGSKVFSLGLKGRQNKIQAWVMWTWEFVGVVKIDGSLYDLNSFHADGSKCWVQHWDSMPKGWNFEISESPPTPLSYSFPERPHLDFISGQFYKVGPSFVKNTVTGREVFRLSGRYASPPSARWDGRYLVAGYRDGEVLILDFKNLCSQ